MLKKNRDDIFSRLGVDHQCDGQTDAQTHRHTDAQVGLHVQRRLPIQALTGPGAE